MTILWLLCHLRGTLSVMEMTLDVPRKEPDHGQAGQRFQATVAESKIGL